MKQVLAAGPVVAAVALIAGVGYAHGLFTDRWRTSDRLEQAVAALDRLPDRFGDWAATDRPARPIDEDELKLGQIKGYVHREYANEKTGERIAILLLCGRGGPISAHTPDICYRGAGYVQKAAAKPREVASGGPPATFQAARFNKPGVSRGELEIFWGWSPDGRGWDAPSDPRGAYARLPALNKLYVIRDILPTSQTDVGDPCRDFLAAALPAFEAALAPRGE